MDVAQRTRGSLVAVLASLLLLGACGDDPDSETQIDRDSSASEPDSGDSITELAAAAQPDGRCAPPSAELLRTQDTAFEGTVTEVGEGAATLDVVAWFVGDATDRVVVSTPTQEIDDPLELAVDFEEGGSYLVSATAGQVSLCGLSAEKDDRLAELFAEAYPS